VSELTAFTFHDTGVKVLIKKVSPLLVVELQKAFPPPAPPQQEVEIGGEIVIESNPAHPDYVATMNEYNREFEMRVRRLLIKRGVEIPGENKEWQEEVAELREFWREEYAKELEGDDKMLYISYIAVGTDGDLTDLLGAIMQRSQPTEAAVAAAKASFPG
jgi:hypothetical protein